MVGVVWGRAGAGGLWGGGAATGPAAEVLVVGGPLYGVWRGGGWGLGLTVLHSTVPRALAHAARARPLPVPPLLPGL